MISGREVGSVIATRVHGSERPEGRPPAKPTSASTAQDGVALSSASATIGRFLSVLNGLPDVRSDRVEAVGARVVSGQAPPSSDVARQILSRVVGDHMAAGG